MNLFANGATPIYYDDMQLCRADARGDVNCDAVFDSYDIEPFVLMLTDPAGYSVAYPGCPVENGDMNTDGHVDGRDIQDFVQILIGG